MEFLKKIKFKFILLLMTLFVFSCGKSMDKELQKPVNLSFDSKGSKNIILQSNFVTKNNKSLRSLSFDSSQKRVFILISSQRCYSCRDEHILIKQKIDDNTLDKSKFNILSFMIATDFSDSYDFQSVEDLINNSNMDWPIGEDINLFYFNKFCSAGTTPCSVVLEPNEGIVYAHAGLPNITELKNILNK